MNELILREATFADRMSLDALFREELIYHQGLMPEVFEIPGIVLEEPWLKSILNDTNKFLIVSEQKGTIVGAILYKLDTNPDDKIFKKRLYGYIEEMIVTQSLRGKGIGKELLNYAVNDLRAKNIDDIEINVWDNNTTGLKFYEKYGFKTIQRRMKMVL
jgi:ribosomal protein S18 acetylase RimI-like enzyme